MMYFVSYIANMSHQIHVGDLRKMQVRGTVNLHNKLLQRVLHLPASFFDTNPSGRILNRFSRDTDIMDSVLPTTLFQVCATLHARRCTTKDTFKILSAEDDRLLKIIGSVPGAEQECIVCRRVLPFRPILECW